MAPAWSGSSTTASAWRGATDEENTRLVERERRTSRRPACWGCSWWVDWPAGTRSRSGSSRPPAAESQCASASRPTCTAGLGPADGSRPQRVAANGPCAVGGSCRTGRTREAGHPCTADPRTGCAVAAELVIPPARDADGSPGSRIPIPTCRPPPPPPPSPPPLPLPSPRRRPARSRRATAA